MTSFPHLVAQNMPPDWGCVIFGLLIIGGLLFALLYTAYRIGYNQGMAVALREVRNDRDDKRRGFEVLPPDQKDGPDRGGGSA